MNNDFWYSHEDAPVAFETRDYYVIVTPPHWREIGKKYDRAIMEFSIVGKEFGTLEAGMNVLASAIISAQTMQDALDECSVKISEVNTNANVIDIRGKDSPK